MRIAPWLFVASFLAPTFNVDAHSIADEVGVGTSQITPVNPRSGYVYERLTGVADLSEEVALRLDLVGTHDNATAPQQGAHFGISGSNIFSSALGIDWNASEHVALSGEVDYSPKSTQFSDAPVTFDSGTGSTQADAMIKSSSSAYGFLVQLGYETAGESDFETSIDGAISVTHYSTLQNVAALETVAGPVDIQRVVDYCVRTNKEGCRQISNAARRESAELNQYRLGASLTETVYANTDLTLSGSYYLYNEDPTKVGYFSVATVGRSAAMGTGVPLAPLHYTIRPEITHVFGMVRASVWYQYGQYVPGDGVSHLAGLRLRFRFSKAVSAWVMLNTQADLDPAGNSTTSGTLAIGLKYRF
jgi:hypothetical protein